MTEITVDEANLIPMFVYGTLRPDWYNNRLLEWDTEKVERGATISGRMYWAFSEGSYPVVNVEQEGTITGDIVYVWEDSTGFNWACRMEIGAGYEPREVTATLPDGTEEQVLVWHYPRTPRGDHIPGGDWDKAMIASGRPRQ